MHGVFVAKVLVELRCRFEMPVICIKVELRNLVPHHYMEAVLEKLFGDQILEVILTGRNRENMNPSAKCITGPPIR